MVPGQILASYLNKIRKSKALAAGLGIGLLTVLSFTSYEVFSRSSSPNPPQIIASGDSVTWPLNWNWDGPDSGATHSSTTGRPVYPYSVIPGGVADAAELQAAVEHDPVVAAHYEGFQTKSVHVLRLRTARQVYVSYRIGNRIFWTRKKIKLLAGETLLSDGSHFVRIRCGNRVAYVPARPNSPQEPTDAQMREPVAPVRPEVSTVSVPGDPLLEPMLSPVLLAVEPLPAPGGPGPGGVTPPAAPIIPCCGGPGGPPTHSTPSAPAPPDNPPVKTPEPSSVLLLLAGLGTAIVLCMIRRF